MDTEIAQERRLVTGFPVAFPGLLAKKTEAAPPGSVLGCRSSSSVPVAVCSSTWTATT